MPQSHSIFLILALVFSVGAARGESNCETRDFRPELGPVRNQKDLSWCFAVSSADLITQKTGKRVSSADLATTFLMQSPDDILATGTPEARKFLEENPTFYSELAEARKNKPINYDRSHLIGEKGLIDAGGNASHAMFLANAKGLCLEKDLPTDDQVILPLLKQAKKLQRLDAARGKNSICVQTDSTSGLTDSVSLAIARNYEDIVDQRCQREPLQQDLLPVQVGERDIEIYLDKYKNDSKGKKKLHDQLFVEMNKALDSGKATEIGYSLYSVAPKDAGESDRDADHSSVIAGRKMIGGVCHYLLRNTQGPGCDFLPKYNKRCTEGHVWLTRKELEPTLYEVTYLK